jgi:hypothetical protein
MSPSSKIPGVSEGNPFVTFVRFLTQGLFLSVVVTAALKVFVD